MLKKRDKLRKKRGKLELPLLAETDAFILKHFRVYKGLEYGKVINAIAYRTF